MNSSSREHLLATKEKLHRLTQENRQAKGRVISRSRDKDRSQQEAEQGHLMNKVKLQAEQQKAQAEERAREDAKYLRRQNKTVAKVLSQVAKADRRGELNDED